MSDAMSDAAPPGFSPVPPEGEVEVTGEIAGLRRSPRGVGFDLLLGDQRAPVWMPTACARPVLSRLAERGVRLCDGVVVQVTGGWRRPGNARSFIAATALAVLSESPGPAAQRRAEVERLITDRHLDAHQRSLTLPAAPLRLALVATSGAEGAGDVWAVLGASPWNWRVRDIPCRMTGPDAPRQVAAALRSAQRSDPRPDAIAIVRGGGEGISEVFDAECVVRAVSECAIPVLLGVGHAGDHTLADLVAWKAFHTPTALAGFLVARVTAADQLLAERLAALAAAADESRRATVVLARQALRERGQR